MSDNHLKPGTVYSRAWEIISQDNNISPDEKKAILKLIQVLIEAAERSAPSDPAGQGNGITTITQEVVSKHSLMTTVKHQADELDALKRISLNLTSSLDLQKVLDAVVTEAMGLLKNARAAHIFLFERGVLEFGASLNANGERNKPVAIPRKNGLTQSVIQTGRQIIVEDIEKHPLYTGVKGKWAGSIVGIPLKFKDDILGVMNLSRSTPGRFTRSELRLMSLLADQAAVAIFNASLYRRVTQMANTDSVTGLPNRRALDERIQEEIRFARRMNSEFSVVMMDLDGFKAVNDTYGHVVGDELLYSLFNYLAENIRPTDFLARYGGDELTLVSREANQDMAESVTQKIIDLVRGYKPAFAEKKNIQLGITAGIAIYPTHSKTAGDLLRAADAALYQAKKHHRGSYSIAKITTGPLDPITLPRRKPE